MLLNDQLVTKDTPHLARSPWGEHSGQGRGLVLVSVTA